MRLINNRFTLTPSEHKHKLAIVSAKFAAVLRIRFSQRCVSPDCHKIRRNRLERICLFSGVANSHCHLRDCNVCQKFKLVPEKLTLLIQFYREREGGGGEEKNPETRRGDVEWTERVCGIVRLKVYLGEHLRDVTTALLQTRRRQPATWALKVVCLQSTNTASNYASYLFRSQQKLKWSFNGPHSSDCRLQIMWLS